LNLLELELELKFIFMTEKRIFNRLTTEFPEK